MIVDEVNVFQQSFDLGLWTRNRLVYQNAPAKVDSRLHQVFCAKVVFGVRTYVVSTKRTLHRVNARVATEIIKERHSRSRLF
jgi:hypothetical protein